MRCLMILYLLTMGAMARTSSFGKYSWQIPRSCTFSSCFQLKAPLMQLFNMQHSEHTSLLLAPGEPNLAIHSNPYARTTPGKPRIL